MCMCLDECQYVATSGRVGGGEQLVGDEISHHIRHMPPWEPIGKFNCNSNILTSREQSLYIFIEQYVEFQYFALRS